MSRGACCCGICAVPQRVHACCCAIEARACAQVCLGGHQRLADAPVGDRAHALVNHPYS